MGQPNNLYAVYEGWEGYQISLVNAVAPLTFEQLSYRSWPEMRSVGEVVKHIALSRIEWFVRMDAPGSADLARSIYVWTSDEDGAQFISEDALGFDVYPNALVEWLEKTWEMVDATLRAWTVDDLQETFVHPWRGGKWAVTRQWVLWRIMAHDIHHGGELAVMLGQQGIEAFELQGLGGHIVLPKRIDG